MGECSAERDSEPVILLCIIEITVMDENQALKLLALSILANVHPGGYVLKRE